MSVSWDRHFSNGCSKHFIPTEKKKRKHVYSLVWTVKSQGVISEGLSFTNQLLDWDTAISNHNLQSLTSLQKSVSPHKSLSKSSSWVKTICTGKCSTQCLTGNFWRHTSILSHYVFCLTYPRVKALVFFFHQRIPTLYFCCL